MQLDRAGQVGDQILRISVGFANEGATLSGDGEPFQERRFVGVREVFERVEDVVVNLGGFVGSVVVVQEFGALHRRVEEVDAGVRFAASDNGLVTTAGFGQHRERFVEVGGASRRSVRDVKSQRVGQIAFVLRLTAGDELTINVDSAAS